MGDLNDKAKEKIDAVSKAAKNATDKVAIKTKDMAHEAGKKMEEGGKRLRDAYMFLKQWTEGSIKRRDFSQFGPSTTARRGRRPFFCLT